MSMRQDFKNAGLDENKERIVMNRNIMKSNTIKDLNRKIEYIQTNISKRVGEIEKRKQFNREDLNRIDLIKYRIQDLEDK